MTNNDPTNRLETAAVLFIGIMLAGLGAATLYHPEFMSRYGLDVASSEARIATRAIIGGGELSLGAFFLLGGYLKSSTRQRLALATFLFCSIFGARLVAVFLERGNELAPIVYRELLAEFIIAALLLVIVFLCRRRR